MNRVIHPAFRLIIWLVAIAGLCLAVRQLFLAVFLPDGRLVVTTDLVRPAPYMEQLKPSERAEEPTLAADGTYRTRIIGEPVYFDLKPPSPFESVTVTLAYENDGNVAVELGALASSLDQQYDLRPLEHRVLDGLPWKRLASGTLSLYDRHGTYASVDEFFRNPPERARVATYRASAPIPYLLKGYAPADGSRETEVSLRGHHRMLTYVKDEPLNFTFVTQDMNRQAGADPVIVTVYRDGGAEAVARTMLPDDGNTTDDQKSSPLRPIPVTLLVPAEGVYKIEFTASADVFIRKIVTRQNKLVFDGSVYLGDHVGYSDKTPPFTVYTAATRLIARTAHDESLQTLTFNGLPIPLRDPNVRAVTTVTHAGLAAITSPKRDVLLEADGLFALNADEWFDPLPLEVTEYVTAADLDRRGIDFVLANYEPSREAAGLATASATFDLSKLAKTDEGEYRFALSVPAIYETLHPFRIARLTFAFHRQPKSLLQSLSSLLASFAPDTSAEHEPTVLPDGRSYGELIP